MSLVPGRMNLINLRPGTLPSVWLRIYGHAKSKAGTWLSQDTPDQSAVRDIGYNYISQILPMMKREWLGLECRREQPVQSADQKHPGNRRVGGEQQARKGRRVGEPEGGTDKTKKSNLSKEEHK